MHIRTMASDEVLPSERNTVFDLNIIVIEIE